MDSSECRECGVALQEGENWYKSDKAQYHYICKPCRNSKSEEWRENNYARVIVHRVRHRAKKRGIPFDLDASDIRIPNFCPVLGIEIIPGEEGGQAHSPSLDRIDPDRGYLPQNVQVISHRANTLKSNASSTELSRVADHLEEIERRE